MPVWKNPRKMVTAVTLFVFVYAVSPYIHFSDDIIILMFLLIPFLTIWMAFVILKYGRKPVRELKEGEEWGYQDRPRDSLGTF